MTGQPPTTPKRPGRRPASGSSPGAPARPRLRGVIHQYAFFVSLGAGALLVALASGTRAAAAVAIYAAALSGLLGVSALYHRVTWSPPVRRWLRRLDHGMIFVLIAGTYTPIALLVLSGPLADVLLVVLWAGALAGAALNLAWVEAPRWVTVPIYIALGWAGIAALPQLASTLGLTALMLVAAGGLLYTLGALAYALRRPDPAPAVFGYHEVFHALVVAAAAAHYAVVALYALPAA